MLESKNDLGFQKEWAGLMMQLPPDQVISKYAFPYQEAIYLGGIGKFTVQAVKTTDRMLLKAMFGILSARSVYMHFFSSLKALIDDFLSRLTQIDYDRQIVL